MAVSSILGCASQPVPPPAAPSVAVGVPDLDQRALLLLLSDRKIYDPFTVDRALQGDAALRQELALVLGRIPDPRCRPFLAGLLQDDDPKVRRAAAFALGRRGESEARPALLRAVSGLDDGVGAEAMEALARLGVPLDEVVSVLAPLGAAEQWRRLLPGLFRFDDSRAVQLATSALTLEDPELHRAAALTLARNPRPEGAPALRDLLADPDPWVQGRAARGLGRIGEAEDLARLRPLLDEDSESPVIEALRAAGRLVASGRAAPPAGWRDRLLELLADPRTGVRIATLEVAGHWLLDPALGDRLAELARNGSLWQRELALTALARGRDPRASELVTMAARAGEAPMREVAVRAATRIGMAATVATLEQDPAPRVRVAVLEAHLANPESADQAATAGLSDPDPAVRTTALRWLADHPRATLEELVGSLRSGAADGSVEDEVAAAAALVARGRVQAAEKAGVVVALVGLAEHDNYVVRRAAVSGLETLGQPPPPLGAATTTLPIFGYREIVLRLLHPPDLELVTEKGSLRITLECRHAQMTCLSFLQLASQGFYDGLTFDRVVPDRLVQGGGPRGDGWGGPGYTVRDEPNLLPFEEGVLGMARSEPDTAGSRFFVTLSRQPQLDGESTAFGRVTGGVEVLHQLEEEDRILSLRPVEAR